jgi:predicted Rossmann fold nucleotide-binding protein DprA/Smf involved in DNA uptake
MGARTSLYLKDDLADRVAASGLTIAQLIERGLGCAGDHAPAPDHAAILARLAEVERWQQQHDDRDAGTRGAQRFLERLQAATEAEEVTSREAATLTTLSPSHAHAYLVRAEQEGWVTQLPARPRVGQGGGRNPIRWGIRP